MARSRESRATLTCEQPQGHARQSATVTRRGQSWRAHLLLAREEEEEDVSEALLARTAMTEVDEEERERGEGPEI